MIYMINYGGIKLKYISIIGASGSVGTQALDVIKKSDNIKLLGVTIHSNIDKLIEIIKELNPPYIGITNKNKRDELMPRLKNLNYKGKVYFGEESLVLIATIKEVDLVLTSVVGMVGLNATIAAIKAKKDIALANKETLVSAGEIVMDLVKKNGVSIYPVDSEHSAIFQCLQGSKKSEVENIIITASGGPFLGKDINYLKTVRKEEALKHPNWEMGAKITIDSSTLMNKGLEVIEARWLFDIDYENIKVVVHPESIVHSMVEYKDSSIIAQLGEADMRLPIQYALNYPDRKESVSKKLDIYNMRNLSFIKPDTDTFKGLKLSYEAGKRGGLHTTVLNSANEEAVSLFLNDKIKYIDIVNLVEKALDEFSTLPDISLEAVFETDKIVREFIRKTYKEV